MTALLLARWAQAAMELPTLSLRDALLGALGFAGKTAGFLLFFYLLALLAVRLLSPRAK